MDFSLNIIYHDTDYLFVWKPAGHASSRGSSQSLLDVIATQTDPLWMTQKEIFGPDDEYGLLNRLDNDTTGIVIFARSLVAKEQYHPLQADGKIRKIYYATVYGEMPGAFGRIRTPIYHHRDDPRRMTTDPSKGRGEGQEVVTYWENLTQTNLIPNPSALNGIHPLRKGGLQDEIIATQNKAITIGTSVDLLSFAKEMRKKSTTTEEYFWQIIRNRNIDDMKFRRQHPIGRYIADFYCAEYGLIIELAGGYHSTITQTEYDMIRDEDIKNKGFHTLRFSNEQINNNIKDVLNTIRDYKNNFAKRIETSSCSHPSTSEASRRGNEGEVAEVTLLRVEISAGCRHQIRCHLASIDHPIIGDPLYTGDFWKKFCKKRNIVMSAQLDLVSAGIEMDA